MTAALVVPVSLLTAALNVPIGRLRAGAARHSHRRFGLLAAATFLALAMRHAFGLSWMEALPILAATLAGQVLGQGLRRGETPTAARWRTAAYGALAAGILLFAGEPVHAREGEWQRLDADEAAPAFTLTSQAGRRVALADFRGKVVVLTFLYTECKDVCPVLPQILSRVDKWLSAEERRRVHFIGISIDARRDTPAKLSAFMAAHDLAPSRWTLLTGSLAEATQAAADYGIVVRPDAQGDLVHNAVYILIDPRGRLRAEFHGLFAPAAEIAQAARALLPAKKG